MCYQTLAIYTQYATYIIISQRLQYQQALLSIFKANLEKNEKWLISLIAAFGIL